MDHEAITKTKNAIPLAPLYDEHQVYATRKALKLIISLFNVLATSGTFRKS
jgi:hypothetical protein